jgi:aspartate/methionine/tyrosine aminotransferase
MIQFAQRLSHLQTNVFADMDYAKAQARAAGREIIDLSLGSSDLAVSPVILERLTRAIQDPSTHGYLLFHGTQTFRQAAAAWYERRFGLAVDPETEVLTLIGSQEGTAHLPLALLNPGDYALLLDPGYPSHVGGVHLAGGQIYTMPLLAENHFLPVLADIPAAVLAQAKMMVLSYPHNPTTAQAPLDFFKEAVAFCQMHHLALVHDFPYVDLVFDGSTPPSVLQADLSKSTSIEFFSLSKSYSMGGFRIGFAIGNPQLIQALRQIKATVDFNQYLGILQAATTALSAPQQIVTEMVETFRARRDSFMQALGQAGWQVPSPSATMYIWAKLPTAWQGQSQDFCQQLVAHTGVAASPGVGFGAAGADYVRFALVHPPEVLAVAAQRIGSFLQAHPAP